jgi:hypothetical protein
MKIGSRSRSVAFAVVLVSGIVIARGSASAQTSGRQGSGFLGTQPAGRSAASAPLVKHLLKGTFFDTSSTGASASCSSAGCTAYAPISSESIVCPKLAGGTCTYQVTIQSQSIAGSNDNTKGEEGVYQFLVDGVAPNPGPVGAGCACYTWSGSSRQFSLTVRGTSYAVTATVKNTIDNQSHSIGVNIGCNEVQGNTSGCFAGSGFANLSIATYTP